MVNKLKCWVKQANRKDLKRWKNKKTDVQVTYSDQRDLGGPDNNISVSNRINKDFSSKSKALKFANEYMKKHDKC